MSICAFWLDLGWLVMLVATFVVALGLDAVGRLTYFTSLTLWAIPITYLWPLFLATTTDGHRRRRRALAWSAGAIAGLGIVLDFLLGHLTFRFPGCGSASNAAAYVWCLPAVGGMVPIEELLFYAMGPVAMVLVYACADERWLSRYSPEDTLIDVRLIQVSPRLLVVAAAAAGVTLVLWRVNGTFPTYFAFLVAGAVLPAMLLYRAIGGLTNWPAFAVTTLYVLVTSIVWEVTLAIPRAWWGYEPAGMLGLTIAAWSRGDAIFPIEAALVWVAAPFSCILLYEFAKAFTHHPATTRVALFGPARAHATATPPGTRR
jgi:hypothetical protein